MSLTRPPSIAVFCGSSDGDDPQRGALASALGAAMAVANWRVVYGGASVGLMGALARGALEANGEVLGVIPNFLKRVEIENTNAVIRTVDDLHQRKRVMADEADGFIVLPGGIGTLEEAVEMLSWARLDLHRKLTVFLDEDGFWDPFFALMDQVVETGFAPAPSKSLLTRASNPSEAITAIAQSSAMTAHASAP